jgi:sulfonate transport system substrate-binding protein
LWAIVICILVGLSITIYSWRSHMGPFPRRTVALEKLTIAVNQIPVSTPVWVALDRGYFKDEGLDVTLQNFFAGKDALESMLGGKSDIATCAETPIMQAIMAGRKLSIMATIATSEAMTAVVVRKDKGISSPSDLEGKRIGVTPYTTGDYLLATFLLFHGIPKNSTKIVPLRADQMKEALESGRVDAVSTWEPHIAEIKRALGAAAQVYYPTGFYRMTWNLVSQPYFVRNRPEIVRKVLRALVKAEAFLGREPEQAMLIAATRLGMDKADLSAVWKSYYFQVALDQSLLFNLENQARWAIADKLVSDKTLPNFMESIYVEGLKSVRPDTVTVIGVTP